MSQVIIEMRERVPQAGSPAIFTRIQELGFKGGLRSVGNHVAKHLHEVDEGEPLPGPKVGDLEILDGIITAGYRNSKNWKPTIKDTLDAMKLKVQMTGNSSFDQLLALFDGPEDQYGDDEPIVDTEAALSEDERPNEDSEDLEEPLL